MAGLLRLATAPQDAVESADMPASADITRLYEAVADLQTKVSEMTSAMSKLQATFEGAHARGRDIATSLQLSVDAQSKALSTTSTIITERLIRLEIQFGFAKAIMAIMGTVTGGLAVKILYDWMKAP